MLSAREVAEQNEIIRIVNGSKLYGTNVASSDDDFMAVFLEPVESVFMRGEMKTVQLRDKPTGVRSEVGDVDCVAFSLRHFAHLAAGGNPSVLTVLSAPDSAVVNETPAGTALRSPVMQQLFASKLAGSRFKGYMLRQKERMLGIRNGHVPKRPELVEQYGFDTKYANHVVRLGLQGAEFMQRGCLTLPMAEEHVALLLQVRTGAFSFDETLDIMDEVEAKLFEAIEHSRLPEEPDYGAVAQFIRETHEEFWRSQDS